MDPARYLTLIRHDSDALVTAAHGRLAAGVPPCPEWSVRDLVEHLAMVYDHKVACMRQLRRPQPWPPEPPAGDPLDWLVASRDTLLHELETRGPEAPSFTWYEPDQSVGFWYRRMAQETAVHRVDAELAVTHGAGLAVTHGAGLAAGPHEPVADDLAVDGVDEVLHVMMASEDWTELPQPGQQWQVRVACEGRTWLVELEPEAVRVTDEPSAAGSATVSGPASDLLLWLWGRLPFTVVQAEGDPAAVSALRARLAVATQ